MHSSTSAENGAARLVPPLDPAVARSADRIASVLDHDTFARLVRARDFLAANACERMLLARSAREALLSPYHFQRLFVRAFGESPHAFVTRLRIERAKHLLVADEASVTRICFDVGYESLGSFSTRFRAIVGVSPSEYRRGARRSVALLHLWRPLFIPGCFLTRFVDPAPAGVPTGPQDPRSGQARGPVIVAPGSRHPFTDGPEEAPR